MLCQAAASPPQPLPPTATTSAPSAMPVTACNSTRSVSSSISQKSLLSSASSGCCPRSAIRISMPAATFSG
jgi:hypothetical protein